MSLGFRVVKLTYMKGKQMLARVLLFIVDWQDGIIVARSRRINLLKLTPLSSVDIRECLAAGW